MSNTWRVSADSAEYAILLIKDQLGIHVMVGYSMSRTWHAGQLPTNQPLKVGGDIVPSLPLFGRGRTPDDAVLTYFRQLKGIQGRFYLICPSGELKRWTGAKFEIVRA